MDKINKYQNLILQILDDYTKVRYANLDAGIAASLEEMRSTQD